MESSQNALWAFEMVYLDRTIRALTQLRSFNILTFAGTGHVIDCDPNNFDLPA
jgi:hypothetical protein